MEGGKGAGILKRKMEECMGMQEPQRKEHCTQRIENFRVKLPFQKKEPLKFHQ